MDTRTFVVTVALATIAVFALIGIAIAVTSKHKSVAMLLFAGASLFVTIALGADANPLYGPAASHGFSIPMLVNVPDWLVLAPTVFAYILMATALVFSRRELTRASHHRQ